MLLSIIYLNFFLEINCQHPQSLSAPEGIISTVPNDTVIYVNDNVR